jgi:hypothetical protein
MDVDLHRLDETVERAIASGSPDGLAVLGYGEITLVLGWPTEAPEVAVKRLPPFASRERVDAYAALLDDWLAALDRSGVPLLETELRTVDAPGGVLRVYLLQPYVARERLLNHVLRRAGPAEGAALLERLAEIVARSVNARVGLDAQAANWVVEDGDLRCLDVSTPLMRDEQGRDRLDLDLFLSIYPWALRPALRRVATSIMGQYHDARGVLLDSASNLHKEHLDAWVPALLSAAARRLAAPIDSAEVLRYFARDKRLWLAMQHLRRTDRAWQLRVRHRPYPFLLPPPYRYGPPELRGETPWTTPTVST